MHLNATSRAVEGFIVWVIASVAFRCLPFITGCSANLPHLSQALRSCFYSPHVNKRIEPVRKQALGTTLGLLSFCKAI